MSEITSKIATFPDDDKERVVWWYGATYLEKTTNPEVEVALRIIKKDKTLSEEASIYRVAITDLCIVRIGSIWKGQSATSNYWNNTQSLQFEFDLSVKKCKIISCFDRDNTLTGMSRTYIPVEKYSLSSIPSSPRRYDLNFLNSKLTVLTSLDGKKVVIPCLELLTSTFTPQEMDIRRQLITKSIDKLLEQYTEPKWCEEKDGEYHVFMREPKAPSNITFLSYLALNPTTRNAVSKIYSQIQADAKGKYPQRFPAIEPWQPDKLKIKVEGLWVKSNYTFLVLRINGYSLPIDKAIVENVYQNIVEESEAKGDSVSFINGDKTVSSGLAITNNVDPGNQFGTAYINSEVSVLGEMPKIHRNIIPSPTAKTKRRVSPIDEATGLSSGESYGGIDSKGIAKLKHHENNNIKPSNRQHIDQTQVIYIVNQALEMLKTEGDLVTDIIYLDERGRRYDKFTMGRFPSNLIGSRGINRWPINELGCLRGFLLVQLTLSSGKVVYLFEIERKSEHEGFNGLMFRMPEGKLSNSALTTLLTRTALNKGKARKRVTRGKMEELQFPVIDYLIYNHSLVEGSMVKKMKKLMKKVL